MSQINQIQATQTPQEQTKSQEKNNARYVYCISQFNGKQTGFGKGIEGNKVYILPFEDICAVVHNCSAEPYESKDDSKAKQWIIQHNNIINKVLEEVGKVIPFRFDTIFKEENQLLKFLKLNREKIKEKLKQLEGKKEFGIKIFYDENLRKQIAKEKTKQLGELEKENKGKTYFLRKKIEKEISAELQDKLKEYFTKFYKKISACGEIITEKTQEKNGLANFSCLVPTDKVEELSRVLDEINKLEGFTVRFTGPWPPYTFTFKLFEEQKNDT
ncbi:MAG: GvpL/GvpF family gas vesicle protein [Nanoarchaeota archaeon]|nr:GvpL/GvpF family gas vesicle protein [Nanoarchaeota archaeon]